MAKIKLSKLSPAGSELFQGAENFLPELSDREIENVIGGSNSAATASIKTVVSSISGGGGVYYANCGHANYGKIANFGALGIKVQSTLINFHYSPLSI
ncbi:MAG: hypothetical protein RLZZ04_2976 [Cyanobacteriota bacterium]